MTYRFCGMDVPRMLVLGAAVLSIAACKDDSSVGPESGDMRAGAYLRYVNSTYQAGEPGTPTFETSTAPSGVTTNIVRTPVVYTAMPIDVLIDSSETGASVMSLAPNSLSVGNAGPEPASLVSGGYRGVSRGVHSFVARKSGMTPKSGYSFYTTATPTEWLPKQHLLSKTTYTLNVGGEKVAPVDSGEIINPPANIPFKLLRDDPFYPPTVTIDGKAVPLGRWRVYNMAPYHTEAATNLSTYAFMTSAPINPAEIRTYSIAGLGAAFRDASPYGNLRPGTYYLTVASGSGANMAILWSGQVTFKAGETKSFFLMNTMPTYTITSVQTTTIQPTGSSATRITRTAPMPTFKVIETLDNVW